MNNELAFPLQKSGHCPNCKVGYVEQQAGMTLRDYFAAKAMNSLISKMTGDLRKSVLNDNDWEEALERGSKHSYQIADAMLKERERMIKEK